MIWWVIRAYRGGLRPLFYLSLCTEIRVAPLRELCIQLLEVQLGKEDTVRIEGLNKLNACYCSQSHD
jgi:hypothetical protein